MSIPRFICATSFFISQNNYFGWHLKAESDTEIIADGIAVLLVALCFMTSSK